MDLYQFPKDILVKLISTLQEDVKKKKIYGVFIADGCGGYFEEYKICANSIDDVYLHFLNLKDKCKDNLIACKQAIDIELCSIF